jgi:hypothetical protein
MQHRRRATGWRRAVWTVRAPAHRRRSPGPAHRSHRRAGTSSPRRGLRRVRHTSARSTMRISTSEPGMASPRATLPDTNQVPAKALIPWSLRPSPPVLIPGHYAPTRRPQSARPWQDRRKCRSATGRRALPLRLARRRVGRLPSFPSTLRRSPFQPSGVPRWALVAPSRSW